MSENLIPTPYRGRSLGEGGEGSSKTHTCSQGGEGGQNHRFWTHVICRSPLKQKTQTKTENLLHTRCAKVRRLRPAVGGGVIAKEGGGCYPGSGDFKTPLSNLARRRRRRQPLLFWVADLQKSTFSRVWRFHVKPKP